MSRNKIFLQVAIALVLILISAFAGQLNKWRKRLITTEQSPASSQPAPDANSDQGSDESDQQSNKSEVLVRFRSGTTPERIAQIMTSLHDEVEDRIEAVDGLDVIEDEDGKDAATVVAQYQALPEVEYAEANAEIRLDHEDVGRKHVHA